MAMEFITHLLAVRIKNFQSNRFSQGARDKTLIHAEIEDLGQGVFLRLQHHQLVAVFRQHAADLAVGIAHVADDACAADTALYTSRQQTCFQAVGTEGALDRKSTRLNSSHVAISYAVFCLKQK